MEILSTVDGIVTVKAGSKIYQIQEGSMDIIHGQVENGADASALLELIAGANAKTAKVFDAEAAARKAEKALKVQALTEFEKDLEGWVWSDNVVVLAQTVDDLRIEQAQIEEAPFSITLEGYDRNSPSKGCGRGEYRFTYYKGVPSLVVGLKAIPRLMGMAQEVDVALANFRIAAANEITVPEVLRTENTSKDFDVSPDGDIIYNVKVNVRKGNGGGHRKQVEYIDEGNNVMVFESKTALGEYLGATSKWPHASKQVKKAFATGKATFLDDQD